MPMWPCGPSGWEGVNSLMTLYEFGGGLMLLIGTWKLRRFAAFAGMCVMASIEGNDRVITRQKIR